MTDTNLCSRFDKTELILRDKLATDRTLLANECTLLSYLCSGIALVIAGVSIIHFSHQAWFSASGAACLPVGIATAWIGIRKYRRMDRAISVIRQKLSGLAST